MTADPVTEAREQWSTARQDAATVLGRPDALPERERELLQLSVLPQIDVALAMLDEGTAPDDLARWHDFLPGAIEALAGPAGLDPGLEAAGDHVRRGLGALRHRTR
jgi:hypothetical protein